MNRQISRLAKMRVAGPWLMLAALAGSAGYASAEAVFEENQAGFCGVDGVVESEHAGYTGSGYANTDNASGNGVDYEVNVPGAGSYTLSFTYANASSARSAAVIVNGSTAASLAFNGTGAWTYYASSATVTVNLNTGDNWIRLEATNGSGLANIDSLLVAGDSPTAGNCVPGNSDDGSDNGGGDNGGGNSGACENLINDPNVNWRESSLQTDQEIVECLSSSLGTPVGFGEKATGGYDPNGNSNLIVIRKNTGVSVEQQILDAISSDAYNWIVFDKGDFASATDVAMYRLDCGNADVQSALGGASEALCRDPQAWCSANGIASSSCLETFFNDRLNDSSLPIRNKMIYSNTTIDGRGSQAYFLFNGFAIGADSSGSSTHVSENVIITNNRFVGVGHDEDHDLDPDMIRSTGESHDIWIHQNTFEHTGDSAFDVKVGAYDITVSFNKLVNVKRAALHGSSDSRTINEQITTTIHNNLFVTTDDAYGDSAFNTLRRVPLMRRGQSHMFNNVFYGYRKDLLSVRVGGRIAFEDNMFLNLENNSKGDDMDYWVENLLRDFREGGLEISGSLVWFSNSSCQLQGSPGDLTASHGSTPDMFATYNSTSRNLINANRFIVGNDLADYVFATAGKGGMVPYNSSYTAGQSEIIAQAPASCQ